MASRKKVLMAASGDLRQSANETCWPAQAAMESQVTEALAAFDVEVERAHPYDPARKHGFIASQKEGLEIFSRIDSDTPIIVAEAVWQYTNHVLPGLIGHRAPILTVANWSGQWPGLVGMLNLNGSLTKAGVPYSTLWSETFADDAFRKKLHQWLQVGHVTHDLSHVRPFVPASAPDKARSVGRDVAQNFRQRRAIMGIFDEGCMGMYNAIIPDELLFPLGVFKERLSQSALYAASRAVSDAEARAVYDWLVAKGMTFHFGNNPETDLVLDQVLDQCRMYIAAARIAETFGCAAIGIQYQQGMKDLMPASDLAEGMLNNDDRPPVKTVDGRPIRDGEAIVHFNEVDECAGLDALFTNRVHRALGQPVETTLHDIRWGDADRSGTTSDYVWVFEISGAAPARPSRRRMGGHRQSAAAADVFPPRRRHRAGDRQARPDRLVKDLRRGRPAEDGPRPRPCGRAAESRDRAALERHDAAMADHARRAAWRVARPVDGPPQGESHPGRLRELRRGGRPRHGGQGVAGGGTRP